MKIRIVKKDIIDGEYYIVQRQNIFKFWVIISHNSVSARDYDDRYYKRFVTLESAKEGLDLYKQYLKKLQALKKDEVVYTETI